MRNVVLQQGEVGTEEERSLGCTSPIPMSFSYMMHLAKTSFGPEGFYAMANIGGVVVYFHILQWQFIMKTKYFFTTLIFKLGHFCFLQHVF